MGGPPNYNEYTRSEDESSSANSSSSSSSSSNSSKSYSSGLSQSHDSSTITSYTSHSFSSKTDASSLSSKSSPRSLNKNQSNGGNRSSQDPGLKVGLSGAVSFGASINDSQPLFGTATARSLLTGEEPSDHGDHFRAMTHPKVDVQHKSNSGVARPNTKRASATGSRGVANKGKTTTESSNREFVQPKKPPAIAAEPQTTHKAKVQNQEHNEPQKQKKKKKKRVPAKDKIAFQELEDKLKATVKAMEAGEEDQRKSVRELVAQNSDMQVKHHTKQTTHEQHYQTSHQLLHGFETLLGALLQLSDELELMSTFENSKSSFMDSGSVVSTDAMNAILGHAPTLEKIFSSLKPTLQHYLETETENQPMEKLLKRAEKLVRLLCEVTFRVCQRQEWCSKAETSYITLLELLHQATMEITAMHLGKKTPEYQISGSIQSAWRKTGNGASLKTLRAKHDGWLFRQVAYNVIVSTDQWCPNQRDLAYVCETEKEAPKLVAQPNPDARLAPTPVAALSVLDKIHGEPLLRASTMSSVLRRILPPHALTDSQLMNHISRSPSKRMLTSGGSNQTSLAISAVPEVLNDPDAMGMAGVGKTTIAAMVANHPDVRRFYSDGVAWIHLGHYELTYARYTQCLREILSQMVFQEGEPLFAELLHTPEESKSRRLRREEGFMIYARDTVTSLLYQRNVLIIVDDVYFESDLEWFQFVPMEPQKRSMEVFSTSVIFTTRCRDLMPVADTVEVDLLEEQEGIQLLVTESGQSSDHIISESKEARSVVRECANHPLAIRSVGRWLALKHATAGVISSVEEIQEDVSTSIDRVLQNTDPDGPDMIYEIMNTSFTPCVNGEPTRVIKYCFAAFVEVFCKEDYVTDYASTSAPPMIPWKTAELLFDTVLEMEEEKLFDDTSLFSTQRKEATLLIPEALSALGVLRVITTFEVEEDQSLSDVDSRETGQEEKFLQIIHSVQQEYGEYLCTHDKEMKEFTQDCERKWNRAFVGAYLKGKNHTWDSEIPDASRDYALEMIVAHMFKAHMFREAAALLANPAFVRGRIYSLGLEAATRRHIADCQRYFTVISKAEAGESPEIEGETDPQETMINSFQSLGSSLTRNVEADTVEEKRMLSIQAGRSHYEIGFSLAEKRCWREAIAHWESSQELLLSALGMVEFVAAILYNVGVVYAAMNEYEQALGSLKQCLRIRGAIHGEEHILYAKTIQKIGDFFLAMSDYTEAMESYNWAMDVMHVEASHHRVDIGDILDNMGNIHYSKGEVPEAMRCYQDALRSKKVELGDDHPELSTTFQHIGNCLSDQGNTEEAIAHFQESIRLKEMDPDGGYERDADVASIEGILNNLSGKQEEGLKCYENALEILVTKCPHKKEKVASLLHLIGCVHLVNGEHKKAMKYFEESLQSRRKVLGFVHLDVASTLFNMAFLHQTRGRLDKSLKCLEEALKIRQLRLPDSEKVALTHEKIGTLAKASAKSKQAEIAFEEALRIRRLIHGDEHETVATVLHEIGDLLDDIGEYDEAMNNYKEALAIRRKRLGEDERVATTLYSMGFTLHNQDESDKALQCFSEALTIRKARLGDNSKEVGDTLNMMGFMQAKQGELDAALKYLWEALRIRETHKDDVKVSETLKNIGNVHREKQEHKLAIECYDECLRIRRESLGDDHEKVADALIALGNVRSDLEETGEAMTAYKEAFKIRSLVHGPKDERVASVLQYMGTLEFRSGDIDTARHYLEDYVNLRKGSGSSFDGDFVNVLFMIGNIHKIQGHDEKAKSCWSEAYRIFEDLGLAEENPQIAKIMNSLLKNESASRKAQPYRPSPSLSSYLGNQPQRSFRARTASPPRQGIPNQQSNRSIHSHQAFSSQNRSAAPSDSSVSGLSIFGRVAGAFKETLQEEKLPKYPRAPSSNSLM